MVSEEEKVRSKDNKLGQAGPSIALYSFVSMNKHWKNKQEEKGTKILVVSEEEKVRSKDTMKK